jgi:RsiW-degrading membrane proteinase PrsW (M82 family)
MHFYIQRKKEHPMLDGIKKALENRPLVGLGAAIGGGLAAAHIIGKVFDYLCEYLSYGSNRAEVVSTLFPVALLSTLAYLIYRGYRRYRRVKASREKDTREQAAALAFLARRRQS